MGCQCEGFGAVQMVIERWHVTLWSKTKKGGMIPSFFLLPIVALLRESGKPFKAFAEHRHDLVVKQFGRFSPP